MRPLTTIPEVTTWLAEANAAFQAREGIVFGDARQTTLNDFVLWLLDQLEPRAPESGP